jgi:hypothetical protein
LADLALKGSDGGGIDDDAALTSFSCAALRAIAVAA